MLSSSWPDIVVPTILVISWLLISPLPRQFLSWLRPSLSQKKQDSQIYPASSSSMTPSTEVASAGSGYILPVLIHHARILPKESQHSFQYPSLFLALKLDDLEQGKTQLNRVFSYTPVSKQWSLSKLDPDGFGRRSFPGIDPASKMHHLMSKSILLKLLYELRARRYISVGPQDVNEVIEQRSNPWDQEIGHVWAIAMPTLLGMGGFNPLTVYYVYRPGGAGQEKEERGKLWLVVLEVHNTFNERHVYICQVGVDEDKEKRRGYQHSWTFAREFHVSPFNDRLGYYQLLMNDLWDPPMGSEEEASESDLVPTLDVRLLLLSPDQEGTAEKQDGEHRKLNKKLLATLMSSKATSNSLKPTKKGLRMNKTNMLRCLAAQPFDLVLPVARIMWEAAKLHWRKGLPVFIRPEQRGEGLDEQQATPEAEKLSSSSYDGVEWPVDLNPTQQTSGKKEGTSPSSGSIYWNQDTFLETACRSQFEQYAKQQSAKHADLCLIILSRNAEVKPCCFFKGERFASAEEGGVGEDIKQLSVYTLSSSFYLGIALYTPTQARLFGSLMDRNWGVSSVKDFEHFFDLNGDVTSRTKGWKRAVAIWARRSHMQWAVRQSPSVSQGNKIAQQLVTDVSSHHPYSHMDTPFSFLLALLLHILIIRLTASISALLHINYVRPPWAQVAEGYQRLLKETQ